MVRFLLAASSLALVPMAQGANIFPSSPLIQLGNDTDIFFDSSVALEINDNLYSTAHPVSATSWTVTPGLSLEYGKDSAFAVNLTTKRGFVSYNKASLADLQDNRDSINGSVRVDDGGPLSLTLESSYKITARNDDLAQQGVDGSILGANILRQSNYTHSFEAIYKLTEKIKVTLGYTNTYNHYLNPTKSKDLNNTNLSYNTNGLTELNTKTVPIEFSYQAFEKLSFGLKYQRDTSDYSAAPYYYEDLSTHVVTTVRNTPYPRQLVKNFYGLTAKGDPTGAGLLNVTAKVGYATSRLDDAAATSNPSFSVNLQHTLSDKLNHSLTLSRDVTASSTGGTTSSKSYTYTVNFTAAEDLSFNVSATKSDVLAGTTTVNTMVYNFGADYKYNPHLSFNLGYNFTDSKLPSAPSGNFQANVLTMSAAFRY
ncbi:MAG: putative beta-barrel porin 2 [Verrucomicrobiota bacterium]